MFHSLFGTIENEIDIIIQQHYTSDKHSICHHSFCAGQSNILDQTHILLHNSPKIEIAQHVFRHS
jgi:hypothetical protein